MICVRQDSAPDLRVNAAGSKNRFPFDGVVWQFGMDFPIKIVQQRGDRPFLLIFAELARVCCDAGLNGKRVTPEIL